MIRSTLFLLIFLVAAGSAHSQPFGYTPLQIQSLFSEDYRNEQYETALVYGRWLTEAHPTQMEEYPGNYRGDRNFRRMINIYEHMSEQQDDPSLREAYLDSALQMYDRVFALFDDEQIDKYRWHFNRGRFFQEHADYISNAHQQALEDYETMFNMDTQRATEAGNGYYVQIMVQNYARRNQTDRAFSIINSAEPYADDNLREFFAETRNELITDPEERIELLLGDLEEDPSNLGLMDELYELYMAIGDSEQAEDMAVRMYEEDPSAENILRLANKHQDRGDYSEANQYFREAHEVQEGSEKAESSLRIAENYLSMRELQEARNYARRAANEDPNWGEPKITIARIYVEAVSRCAGGDMGRRDKAVYWLVLDYLDEAKERNSGVASTADRLYRTYEPVTPTAEEKFYQNWNTGESLEINGSLRDCYSWIAEETTVR
ncbi:tetratricopeptide repeat protein [Natronogracilivirga saccharolytica]|uniref:Tetratricopeptide repeat protein n=1 Tax=Natronogracilivirga saccharolytica TaxID=2812953 RepID=A0A8J7UTN5_9BACT|nr:hypothetical protein [Natronogracilivirga saccharolytica]MBP3191525.1 hypothetical protein [Natronogracilivirga saccharolytica]